MSGQNWGPLSPAATYPGILNINSQGQGLIDTFCTIDDGLGNNTSMTISTIGINFDRTAGQLQLDGIALTASATTLNNITFAASAAYVLTSSNAGLPNGVIITAGSGISVTPGGGNLTIAASGELAALNSLSSTGLMVRTGAISYTTRSITSSNGSLTVTNGSGVSGNIDIVVASGSSVQKVEVENNSILQSIRPILNFIAGVGVSLLVADNSGNNSADITISASGSGGTVTSVSGTSNRITSTGGTTPVIDISASYVGQSSITTLGTITTGTWNGTTINVAHGGTGNTTFTAYSVIAAGTTATGAFQNVSGLGTAGQVLTSAGAGALPTWSNSGAGTVTSVSGTAGQIDVATGTTTPVISIDAAYVGQASITTLGTVTTGTWNGTAIDVAHGGTGDGTFTAFSLITAGVTPTGTFQNVTGLGTSGQVLTSAGAGTLPIWADAGSGTVTSVSGTTNRITVATGTTTPVIDISASYVGQASITTLGTITTGTWNGTTIDVAHGGTGATTLTSHGIVLSHGTSALTSVLLSAGQVLIGTTASDPVGANLTGTANQISVLSASGAITLSLPTDVIITNSVTAANLELSGNTLSSTNTNGNVIIAPNGTGSVQLNNGTNAVPLRFYNSAGTHFVAFKGGALTTDTTWTLPLTDSTGSQALVSNGSGVLSWSDLGTGSVTSVSGTTNRITSTGGTTPVIDISASYVGQVSITTLGTVTTGTWNGSLIPLAFGGTNANLTASNGGIFYSTASAAAILAGTATANQVLLSGSSTTPAWSTATYPATTTINQILYSSSANTIAGLATGNSGVLITSAGGVPSISSTLPSAVQGNITSLGTIASGVWNGTAVTVPFGGTGNTTFTAYSIIAAGTTATGTFQNVSGVGTSGQVLTSNGAAALPTWQTIVGTVTSVSGTTNRITSTGGATPVIDISASYVGQTSITTLGTITTGTWNGTAVTVPFGGTGLTTFTTAYGVVCAGTTATGALQNAGVGTSGQVLTSNGAGALPTWSAAGSGTVTSVSGTTNRITVATGTTTPVIDIAATYVGQASITTLGTITTGTWSGTTIAVSKGGTGATTLTAHGILLGEGTSAFTSVVLSAGQVLIGTTASDPVGASITGTANQVSVASATGSITISLPSDVIISNSVTAGNLELLTNTFSSTNTNGNIIISPNGTGSVQLNNGTNAVPLRFYNSAGTHFVAFKAGSLTVDTTWTLPTTDSTGSQALVSNGSGVLSWASVGTGTVTSVSGTAGQISVANGTTTPVISIDVTYVGQASITTLGTITTGTWHGTAIDAAHGGTGLTSLTAHGVLIGEGTSSVNAVVLGAGQILVGTTSTDPVPASITGTAQQVTVTSSSGAISISLPAAVVIGSSLEAGNLQLTGNTLQSVNINGEIILSVDGTAAIKIKNGTSVTPLQFFNSAGTQFVAFQAGTLSTSTTWTLPTTDSTGTQALVSDGSGILSWQTMGTGTVTSVSGTTNRITSTGGTTPVIDISASYVGQGSITTVGTITAGIWNGNTIDVAHGGTGDTSFTAYSIICGGTTSGGVLQNVSGLGTSGQVLTSNGAATLPTWQAAGIGTVTSVSGVSNRITVANPTTTPLIDISAAYVGQASIITLGAVSTGTWTADVIDMAYGGTGADLSPSNGGIFYSTASTGAILSGTGTAHQVLLSGASAAPSWSTATYPVTTTTNQLLYSSATNTIAGLATANNGVLVTSGGGAPSISSTLPSAVQGNITTVGTITSGTWNGTTIDVADGGTGGTTFTAYSVICAGTTATGVFQHVSGLGTSGQILTSNGAAALPTWQDIGSGTVTSVSGTTNRITVVNGTTTPVVDIAATYVGQTSITTLGTITTGTWNGTTITVANGGTGATTLTSHGIVLSHGTSALTSVLLSAGQVLIGTTAGDPSAASIAGTANQVTVTNATGAITISLPTDVIITNSVTAGNLELNGNTFSSNNTNGNIVVAANGTGSVQLNNGTNVTPLAFYNSAGTHFVAFKAGTLSADTTWTLPTTDSTGSQALVSNGSGILSWASIGAGTVTSVSGTTNRITSTGGATPVIDISASYVGQSSITTLGTITTGTWNGTTIDVAHGGTGNTTFTAYSIIAAGTTATGVFQNVSGLGTSGQVLTSVGAGALPTWQTPSFSGTVTNVATGFGVIGGPITTTGTIVLDLNVSTVRAPCVCASSTILTVTYNNGSSGVGATLTNAGTQAAFSTDGITPSVGDRILIQFQASQSQNGIYTLTNAGSGSTNWVLTRATDFDGAISGGIAKGVTTLVLSGTTYGGLTFEQSHAGPFTIGTTSITFVVPQTIYGTANQITISGGVASLPSNTIISNSLQAGNIKIGNTNGITSTNTDGDITIIPNNNGNLNLITIDGIISLDNHTGAGSISLYASEILKLRCAQSFQFLSFGSSAPSPVQFYNQGNTKYVAFIANASIAANVTWTLPNTDSTGTQFLASDGSGNLSWKTTPGNVIVNQNSSSVTMSAGSQYYINNGASLVTLTLPVVTAVGDSFEIIGGSSGGWTVALNNFQQIFFSSKSTTNGVTGSISSTNQYNCVTIKCISVDTNFVVTSSSGSLTVV